MRACIYQAGYLQPLHYYARILESNKFIHLENVQLNRKVGQNKAFVKADDKCPLAMVVPLYGGHRVDLKDAEPMYDDFVDKHLETIKRIYSKRKMFDCVYPAIKNELKYAERHNLKFADMCFRLNLMILRTFLLYEGEIIRDIELDVKAENPSELMAVLTEAIECDEYVCGKPAYDNYLNLDDFAKRGINVKVQDWQCEEYSQKGKVFIGNLSILDLIMNVEPREAKRILMTKK